MLWLANGIDIVLCPTFIYGLGPLPDLGVTGAALATNVGRGIGCWYALYYLTSGSGRIALRWRHMRLSLDVQLPRSRSRY